MATSTGPGADQAITSAFICPTVVSTPAGFLPRERLLPVQTIRSIVAILALGAASLASSVTLVMAEQASAPSHSGRMLAGRLDAGGSHACAILGDSLGGGEVRCWGEGDFGRLGYANTDDIGDDETPGSFNTVDLGPGDRTATAIVGGAKHTCAILTLPPGFVGGEVRCWGQGALGRLGYANTEDIGDEVTPGSVGPVDLGAGRTATAIAAGDQHTCAILDDGTVLCWGASFDGRLGYANTEDIGNDETPGSVGPVDLGVKRTAAAIAAGDQHTCAILNPDSGFVGGEVLCWGDGDDGRLGYGNEDVIGDDETPGSVGPVDIGGSATALTAGSTHNCVVLESGRVRCWGLGHAGRLGYANTDHIGDDENPSSVGPVALGGIVAVPTLVPVPLTRQ